MRDVLPRCDVQINPSMIDNPTSTPYNTIGREVRDSPGPEGTRCLPSGHFYWPWCRP
jgi:hypothetical protein